MSQTKFICMCAPAGSGKTTFSKKYSEIYNAKIICADEFNDVVSIFEEIKVAIQSGQNVIYDSVNTSIYARRTILQLLDELECYKIILVINISEQIALERNRSRERQVKESIIRNQFKNFIYPTIEEGWNEIVELDLNGDIIS